MTFPGGTHIFKAAFATIAANLTQKDKNERANPKTTGKLGADEGRRDRPGAKRRQKRGRKSDKSPKRREQNKLAKEVLLLGIVNSADVK